MHGDADFVFIGKRRHPLGDAERSRVAIRSTPGPSPGGIRFDFLVSEIRIEAQRISKDRDAGGVELRPYRLVIGCRRIHSPLPQRFPLRLRWAICSAEGAGRGPAATP